jgi:hypothetical protein
LIGFVGMASNKSERQKEKILRFTKLVRQKKIVQKRKKTNSMLFEERIKLSLENHAFNEISRQPTEI